MFNASLSEKLILLTWNTSICKGKSGNLDSSEPISGLIEL